MNWVSDVAIAAIVFAVVQRIMRSRGHRRIAERLGFQFLGFQLPDHFTRNEAHVLGATDDVMHGMFQGLPTIVLDHSVNGETGYIQTLAFMRSPIDFAGEVADLGSLWRASELTLERAGQWVLVYRPKIQVTPTEIPSFLTACINLLNAIEDKRNSTPVR